MEPVGTLLSSQKNVGDFAPHYMTLRKTGSSGHHIVMQVSHSRTDTDRQFCRSSLSGVGAPAVLLELTQLRSRVEICIFADPKIKVATVLPETARSGPRAIRNNRVIGGVYNSYN